jgi:ATP-dependent Zn protease
MNNRKTALSLGAVAATAFDLGVPVANITVVPCNNALGFVQFGTRRITIPTLSDLEARLKVAVASVVGEEMFNGERSTSCTADLMRAHRIAEQMQQLGDNREPIAIVQAAMSSVRTTLGSQERNVRRIADALVREGSLNAHAFQQVIGGE